MKAAVLYFPAGRRMRKIIGISTRALLLGGGLIAFGNTRAVCAAVDPKPSGIYVATHSDPDKLLAESTFFLDNADVEGAFIRLRWNELEPGNGSFLWTSLDEQLARTKKGRTGKKVSIGVIAGQFTPSWLYTSTASVKSVELKVVLHETNPTVASRTCVTMTVPVPWDPNYLYYWDRFLHAFSKHIQDKFPIVYERITVVKITGINRESLEIRLPQQVGIQGKDCTSSDANEKWLAAGYKRAHIAAAWKAILGSFAHSFPTKSLSMAVIDEDTAFPVFNDDPIDKALTQRLIEIGTQQFRGTGRFIVQSNAVMPRYGTPAIVKAAANSGIYTGYQLRLLTSNDFVHDCPSSSLACTSWVNATVNNVLSQGGKFLEVYPDTVEKFPDQMTTGKALFNAAPAAP